MDKRIGLGEKIDGCNNEYKTSLGGKKAINSMKAHNGKVKYQSRSGKGTKVEVILPIAQKV